MQTKELKKSYFDTYTFLQTYWPQDAKSSLIWHETKWLVDEYVEVKSTLKESFGTGLKNLDISTGPALAPIIAIADILTDLQMSDYDADSRIALQELDIRYWEDYAEEAILHETGNQSKQAIKDRLKLTDKLRKLHKPLDVDIKKKDIFSGDHIDTAKYDFITMHFVADSITDNKTEYFDLLDNVLAIIKPGDVFTLSALLECTSWENGNVVYPSPDLKLENITNYLELKHFKLMRISKHDNKMEDVHNGKVCVITSLKK